jgi:predicted membrane protein
MMLFILVTVCFYPFIMALLVKMDRVQVGKFEASFFLSSVMISVFNLGSWWISLLYFLLGLAVLTINRTGKKSKRR